MTTEWVQLDHLYYMSAERLAGGGAGYGVLAASGGVDRNVVSRPPKSISDSARAGASWPIPDGTSVLARYRMGDGWVIVRKSPVAKDNMGRSGNYLNHAILDPEGLVGAVEAAALLDGGVPHREPPDTGPTTDLPRIDVPLDRLAVDPSGLEDDLALALSSVLDGRETGSVTVLEVDDHAVGVRLMLLILDCLPDPIVRGMTFSTHEKDYLAHRVDIVVSVGTPPRSRNPAPHSIFKVGRGAVPKNGFVDLAREWVEAYVTDASLSPLMRSATSVAEMGRFVSMRESALDAEGVQLAVARSRGWLMDPEHQQLVVGMLESGNLWSSELDAAIDKGVRGRNVLQREIAQLVDLAVARGAEMTLAGDDGAYRLGGWVESRKGGAVGDAVISHITQLANTPSGQERLKSIPADRYLPELERYLSAAAMDVVLSWITICPVSEHVQDWSSPLAPAVVAHVLATEAPSRIGSQRLSRSIVHLLDSAEPATLADALSSYLVLQDSRTATSVALSNMVHNLNGTYKNVTDAAEVVAMMELPVGYFVKSYLSMVGTEAERFEVMERCWDVVLRDLGAMGIDHRVQRLLQPVMPSARASQDIVGSGDGRRKRLPSLWRASSYDTD